ncbi:hypothetical protein BFJ72_g11364 [Fusarium proliferatum]|uniref:Nudix hydrolase domain-containing protein n=1 Tax=Gibberella intermedia TaxID=948311 RepID=A0A420SNE1_GIBIN|nr:hypothetical protein BFJ72_g11364 [Fusarium proliferatum]
MSTTLKSHNIPLSLPDGLSEEQLASFKPFTKWVDTLTNSLRLQSDESHPFHKDPYALRSVTIQSYDLFGAKRVGFIKLTATVSNDSGETLPAAALLRGPSVAMLFMLIPSDAPPSSPERYVVLTVQPRVPAGSLSFTELPAGMVDDAGSFAGAAAQEIKEELGVTIKEEELTNLSELATAKDTEDIAKGMFPSAGGCDEYITIFSYEMRIEREKIKDLRRKLAGSNSPRTSRTWESAERLTRPKTADIDGVGIVAILPLPTGPELILQKQYRPPINAVTIEVPAGLIDEGETPEECAIRELREETGYVGVATETSPMMFNDPGFCNTNLKMVHVSVDMDLPENKDLKPELEEGEFIEVFTVKLTDLWGMCETWEKEGCAIDARVGTLAEGILLAQRFKL